MLKRVFKPWNVRSRSIAEQYSKRSSKISLANCSKLIPIAVSATFYQSLSFSVCSHGWPDRWILTSHNSYAVGNNQMFAGRWWPIRWTVRWLDEIGIQWGVKMMFLFSSIFGSVREQKTTQGIFYNGSMRCVKIVLYEWMNQKDKTMAALIMLMAQNRQ